MKKQQSSSTGLASSSATFSLNGYSTPPTSIAASSSHRWSEVVPPKTALTFAVVWDAEADMVAFSGAHLFDAVDTQSTSGYSMAGSSTFQWFQDNHEYLFEDPPFTQDHYTLGRSQTLSTLMGPELYTRPSAGQRNTNRYYSCMDDLDKDVVFDPQTDFAKKWIQLLGEQALDGEAKGFYDTARNNGSNGEKTSTSRRLTTLTTSFVAIDSDDAISTWTAVVPPSPLPARDKVKRLRKTRPEDKPVHPRVVLGRDAYNHSLPSSCSPSADRRPLFKFMKNWRNEKGKHFSWVCVELSQEIGVFENALRFCS